MGLNEMLGAWPSTGLLVQPGHRAATSGLSPTLIANPVFLPPLLKRKRGGRGKSKRMGKAGILCPLPSIMPCT